MAMTLRNRQSGAPRRRVLVFALAFLPAVLGSLAWVYSQPPEYRAAARLEIVPPAAVTDAPDDKAAPVVAADPNAFLTEVQVLSSRPLLQEALVRLQKQHGQPEPGSDPAASAQRVLHIEPIAGTQVVQLWATGPRPELPAALLNALVDAYRARVERSYKALAADTVAQATAEAGVLAGKIAAQRAEVDAWRERYDIVSLEHRENAVLADIDGLSRSYNDANEKLARAQGRVDALRHGQAVVHAEDDPTLADLQRRGSMLQEQWQEMQRRFTPAYLALDPDAKALRARIDNLDAQLKTHSNAGGHAAVIEAQQDLTAAQAAVAELRQDLADNQKKAQEFAEHLNRYKAMSEDLDHLEAMRRSVADRLAKLQASERERAPRIDLLEAAAANPRPWRPDYRLEAALALGGSLVFALFAVWLVDFLAGPRRSAPAVVQYSRTPAVLAPQAQAMFGPHASAPPLAAPELARLPPPAPPGRELGDAEIGALLAAAGDDARLAAMLLLSGLAPDEIAALRRDDIDDSTQTVHIQGAAPRLLPLQEPLRSLVAARPRDEPAASVFLAGPDGNPLGAQEIDRLILFAAWDSALDSPQEVTADTLRYTYLGFLLRQGIRAADIERIVGRLPQGELVAAMQLHSPAARRPLGEIERVHPTLREFASAAIG
jgi:polysaccharide biosynthesis transport protein